MHEKLRILVAPAGFKEALGPEAVASALEEGLRRVVDDQTATITKLPLHDGGEGFCKALVASHGGQLHELTVTGPVAEPVRSYFGLIQDQDSTAVLDMAAAAGLRLVPRTQRDPTITTTYGVGELICAALDAGATRILIGCGDSGTSDGGAGMLQALGARLLDRDGHELPRASGGGALSQLAIIVMDHMHPRLQDVKIEVICNIKNVLCGPRGVARVYGPQKGATPSQVETLAHSLETWAAVVTSMIQRDIATMPGGGASGGLGSGLLLLGAHLRSRQDAINDLFCIAKTLDQSHWDFVFTAEGGLDEQSAQGKMTVEVARRFRDCHNTQVIALAGILGEGADSLYDEGIAAFASIPKGPISLLESIQGTESLLRDAAERTMRMIWAGMQIQRVQPVVVVDCRRRG